MLRQDGIDSLISLRVTPKSLKNAVIGVKNSQVLMTVRAAPADGEANAAVIATLSAFLGCSKAQINLIRGHKSRDKGVRIVGVEVERIAGKLGALV